jgi:hypothetical protein
VGRHVQESGGQIGHGGKLQADHGCDEDRAPGIRLHILTGSTDEAALLRRFVGEHANRSGRSIHHQPVRKVENMIAPTGLRGIGRRQDIAPGTDADLAMHRSKRSRSKPSGSNDVLPRGGIPTNVRQGGLAIVKLRGALLNLNNGYGQCLLTEQAKTEDRQNCRNDPNLRGKPAAGCDIDILQKMVKAQIDYLAKVEAALAKLHAKAKRPGDAMAYEDQLRELAVTNEKLALLRGQCEELKKTR